MSLKLPSEIMMNEERKLQEQVEYLFDNNWCGNPYRIKKASKTIQSKKTSGAEFYIRCSLKELGITPERVRDIVNRMC